MVKMKKKIHKCKVAPLIPVLIWHYPGNTGIYSDIYLCIYPRILGILGTPVLIDLPLAILPFQGVKQKRIYGTY